MIWKQAITIEGLNSLNPNTMLETLGIEFTEYGDDYLVAKMPVDSRTVQPFRLLHGGASATLAESVGSTAAFLCIENAEEKNAVGVELNCSHLRSARKGFVYAKATPIKVGRTMQVWNIDITDEDGKMICVSRLTMAIIDRR